MRKKYIYLFLLLSLAGTAKAQRYQDLFETEAYKHTLNYPDHKIVFQAQPANLELRYIDTDKKYYWFSNNQIKVTQGGFSGKLLHGLYSDYYLNSNLKEQGHFRLGLKQGEWKTWTEDGALIERANYNNGEANGRFYKYDKRGLLLEEGSYKHGKINGKLKQYIKADSVLITKYKNGVLQAKQTKPNWLSRLFKKKDKKAQTMPSSAPKK